MATKRKTCEQLADWYVVLIAQFFNKMLIKVIVKIEGIITDAFV